MNRPKARGFLGGGGDLVGGANSGVDERLLNSGQVAGGDGLVVVDLADSWHGEQVGDAGLNLAAEPVGVGVETGQDRGDALPDLVGEVGVQRGAGFPVEELDQVAQAPAQDLQHGDGDIGPPLVGEDVLD